MNDDRKTYAVNVTLIIEARSECDALEAADEILAPALPRVEGFAQYLLPHWRDVEVQDDNDEETK